MIRVVIDANVFVSAAIKPGSNPDKIIDLVKQGKLTLMISKDILAEIKKVLLSEKIRRVQNLTEKKINQSLREISRAAVITPGRLHIQAVKDDPQDNKYLECAIEGRADFIISGDHHLTDLKTFQGIKILAPAAFLKLLTGS